ncbi:MAG: metal ABC transporter ATP-binding protein [Bacillota bacterium]|nr:metal ABC transporter ATP-binding protein [Bacillota bacterium]
MNGAEAVRVEDVSFRYTDRDVLQHVSFSLKVGDMLGLVGPNGSGKSTLLRLMVGLLPLRRGKVYWFGQPLASFRERWRIGYVPQRAGSFMSGFPATVEEVVQMGLVGKAGLLRPLGRQGRERALAALEEVGMADFFRWTIGALSGGQQQRVLIARALVADPDILILDEPTVGVDHEAEERFYDLLHRLHRERSLTIIMVSHDLGVISHHMDTIACLNHELLYFGPSDQFLLRQDEVVEAMYGAGVRVVKPALSSCAGQP